jgi:hypothetical protein
MTRVIIESPYAGDVARNLAYAKRCLLDSIQRGEAPFASHLIYTLVLDDADVMQRARGIYAGFCWGAMADKWVVYTYLGISVGMQAGIEAAKKLNKPIEYRSIGIK